MRRYAGLLFVFCLLAATAFAQADNQWKKVDEVFGRPGKVQDGIYKVTFPRTDLRVTVDGIAVQPALALTSWIAIRGTGQQAIADGDLVLSADEVNPVISALQDSKVEITAVHNHLIGEQPQVYYVHFFGRGPTQEIASALKQALSKSKTPLSVPQPPTAAPWDTAAVEKIMGKKGTTSGTVLGFAFARTHSISMHQQTLPPPMGMATAINFQPAPGGVASSGDFVLRESEVNPVIATLRKHGIRVTAVHNHMLDDEPRMVFVHFWGVGSAQDIAGGLHDALAQLR